MSNLAAAIKRGGGIVKFSRDMNVTMQAIAGWKKRGHVPFERATDIEKRFGVPRESLVHPETAAAYLTPRQDGLDIL